MVSLTDKTRLWTGILKITLLLCWKLFGLYCEILTTYSLKEIYIISTCSIDWVQFLANSPIMCATTCSLTRACMASVYHRNNKTCFNIRGDPSNDKCPMELIGAHFYEKEYSCPPGWKRGGWSCYKLTDTPADYYATEAICRRLSSDSHLAYMKTKQKKTLLKRWIMDEVFESVFTQFWIGAWANGSGWFWSDGMPVKDWNWAPNEPDNTHSYCMIVYNKYFRVGDRGCDKPNEYRTGLCQLDLV